MSKTSTINYKLPPSAPLIDDIFRLKQELGKFYDQIIQWQVRLRLGAKVNQPLPSQLVADFVQRNKLDINEQTKVKEAVEWLDTASKRLPRLTLKLARGPEQELLMDLAAWFREHIDPLCVLEIRVQPTLGGGFILTTSSKSYDYSWAGLFARHTSRIAALSRELSGETARGAN